MTRRALGVLAGVALIAASSDTARGFATFGSVWPRSFVTMQLRLAGGAGLSDGSASYNAVAAAALSTWNQHLNRMQFAGVSSSSTARGDGNGINEVFFDSTYYGESFGTDTLAITTRWTVGGVQRSEADVVFNNRIRWDSYSGPVRAVSWDIRRIALHEFGHALGLDHPDEHGQAVAALLNSTLGNRDALTDDDIAGAQTLYGEGVTGNITFPPRSESSAFYAALRAIYQDELRAPLAATYVDSDAAVMWLTEYTRQRVGQCTHAIATEHTLGQLTGGMGTLVCAATPAGAIPFPPRNEGLLFMNVLNATYRDSLRRSLGASYVDNEGAVVWVLEYLRYRVNGCNHSDATGKVLMQIRGLGIQAVCTA